MLFFLKSCDQAFWVCYQERARRAQQHNDTEANRRAAAEKALTERMHREEDRRAVNKEISGEVGMTCLSLSYSATCCCHISKLEDSPQLADTHVRAKQSKAEVLQQPTQLAGTPHSRPAEEKHGEAVTIVKWSVHVVLQEGFFNFGAASEKWIAPERRVKHIHTPAVHRSSVFPAVPQTPSAQVRRALNTPHPPLLLTRGSAVKIIRLGCAESHRITAQPLLSCACLVEGSVGAAPGSRRAGQGWVTWCLWVVQGTPRSAFLASAPATPVRTPVSCESKPASGMQHPWAWDAEPMHSKGRR